MKVIYKTITTGSSAIVVPVTIKETITYNTIKGVTETAPPVTEVNIKKFTETEQTEKPVTIEKDKTVTEKIEQTVTEKVEKPVTYTVVDTKVVPTTTVEVVTTAVPTGQLLV